MLRVFSGVFVAALLLIVFVDPAFAQGSGIDPALEQMITELLTAVAAQATWVGKIGAGATLLVRIFRLDPIQGLLPSRYRWDSWPRWGQWLAILVTVGGGTALLKLGSDLSVAALVVASVSAGAFAIFGHKASKAALTPVRHAVEKRVSVSRPMSLVMDVATGKVRMGRASGPGHPKAL